jgi:LysM repeat protein
MTGKIVTGVLAFTVLVLLAQIYLLDEGGGPEPRGRSGAAPTATLPARTPEATSLGSINPTGASPDGGGGTTGGGAYVVQSGDTLDSIAAAMDVAPESRDAWIAQVLELNGIADARLIQAGQELTLPAAPAAASGTVETGTPASGGGIVTQTPTPSGDITVYTVVSGDTLVGIAEKFCVEGADTWVEELAALNGIEGGAISAGQELELPAGTPEQCAE